MPWELEGNVGTKPPTQFLGTMDDQPLVVKTNGAERLQVDTSGGIGIGGAAHSAWSRLAIEDSAVPLSFRETDQPVDQGGLWRMPLDNGVLRFDVNTGAAGQEFKKDYICAFAMTKEGNVGIGTMDPGARLHVEGTSWLGGPNYDSHFPWTDNCAYVTGDAIIFRGGEPQGWAERMRIHPNGVIQWGGRSHLTPDQGGSIELGGDSSTPGEGTPYIDFHYRGMTQEYNTRIINDADGRLSIKANTLFVSGNIEVPCDIILTGADCAEEFCVAQDQAIDAGMVMVIDHDSILKPCDQAYDKRVAGVISGAGDLKPGIRLGKQQKNDGSLPLALVGKVYCMVDARFGSVEVGDLLTTSPTPGYAMKASDPAMAFGAVIGKALEPLLAGTALIPIIVALQ